MSVYLRQIVCDAQPIVWECSKCSAGMSMDDAFLSDDGALCEACCRNLYPSRFACDCGQCFQCLLKHDHEHQWKTYDSGWDKYDYCDCGEKRRT